MSVDWDAEVLGPVMAEFGQDANDGLPIYTPLGLGSFALADAVFDDQYHHVTIDQATGAEVTTVWPVLGVRRSLFPRDPAQDDAVYIPSVDTHYLVSDQEADGHGHVKLFLMVAAP